MLMLATLSIGLLLIGGLQAGMERVSASPQATATPTLAISPSALTPFSGNQQPYMPLIGSPFHVYLPLALFENAAPQVSSPFPAQKAVRSSLNAYLAWSHSGDPEGDDYWFEVYLEMDDETPDELIGETTSRFLEPPAALALDTRYYWQVVAVDARGAVNAGPVWTFSTENLPYPPPVGEMIPIPAGEFSMGCDSNNPAEDVCVYGVSHVEIPLRNVYLDAYQIDKYEVTNQQYRACVDAGHCAIPRRLDSRLRDHYYDDPTFDYYPVLYVSWWDAQGYCAWVDKRLPTEAEWEKAARGVVDTRRWPWGNENPNCSLLNYTDDGADDWIVCVDDTTEVGSYPAGASPFGLMDVAGNAFEWVSDKYDVLYYSYAPNSNPTGPDFSRVVDYLPPEDEFPYPLFTIRGGSYRPHWFYPRVAHRHWGHHGDSAYEDEPYFRNDQVGFRCASAAEE